MVRKRAHALAAAVLSLAAVAPGLAAAVPLNPGEGAIRVLHASPDAPPVDVFVDGAPTSLTALAFQGGTPYVTLPSGPYQFDVVPSGGAITDSVLTISTVLGDQEMVSAVAYDEVAAIKGLTATDEEPSTDTLSVRAFHTAVGVGTVNLTTVDGGVSTVEIEALAFGESTPVLDFAPGAYTVGLDVDNDQETDVAFELPDLPGGTFVNLYAVTDDDGPFLLAQLGDSSVTRIDPVVTTPDTASVRFLHASADAPPVDVFLNGAPTSLTMLAFTEQTDYVELPFGDAVVDIVPSGGTIGDSVLTVGVTLDPGVSYTAVAYDEVASLSALALVDEREVTGPAPSRLRLTHLVPGAGPVDLLILNPNPNVVTIGDVAFGTASDYQGFASGTYALGLDFDNDLDPEVVFPATRFEAGDVRTFHVLADDTGVFLLSQTQDGPAVRIDAVPEPDPASVRFLHASPDAPPVDVFLNGAPTSLTMLGFEQGTPYVEVPAGLYTVDIVPTGGAIDDSVLSVQVNVAEGRFYTASAYDTVANLSALAVEDNYTGLTAGAVRVRAIHHAVGVGTVNIVAIDGTDITPLAGNLDFGAASDVLFLAPGAYRIGLDTTGDLVPDVVFDLPELAGGTYANVYAVTDGDGPFLLALLNDSSVVRIDPVVPAQVRALHASPDAPPVDLYVNGQATPLAGLPFGLGTPYVPLPPGPYTFDIVPTGGTIDDSVLTIPLVLEEGTFYSAAAYDFVSNITALSIVDDYDFPTTDTTRIRAIHTASGVGEVDVLLLGEPNAVLFGDLAFGAAADALDVPAGTYSIGLDLDNDLVEELRFDLPELDAGDLVNIYAVADGDGAFLLLQGSTGPVVRVNPTVVPEPDPASIRFLHASPDAPPVDLFVDGLPTALTGLAFQEGTGYVELPPGTYDFDVVPTGGTIDDSVLTVTQALAEGGFYSAAAFNEVLSIQAIAVEDTYDVDPAQVRVRAIHAAVGVGTVDVLNVIEGGNEVYFDNVAFGEASLTRDIPAGEYLIGLDLDNDFEPEVSFQLPALPGGTVANLYAVADAGGPFLLAQLNDSSVTRIDPVVIPEPDPASIRFLHASPDAPPVDLFVDGLPTALTGLAFQEGTGYVELPPGTYDFDVVPTGGTIDDSVLTVTQSLAEGEFYSASAFDNVANIQAVAFGDSYDIPADNIRVRVIHNAVGVGEVDLLITGSAAGANIPGLGFGQVSGPVDAPAGQYNVRLDVDSDGEPDFVFELPSLPGGTLANVYAVADAGGPFLLAQLDDSSVTRIDPVPGEDTGDGTFDNPYQVLVSEGGRTGITIDRPEDYLAVTTEGQSCTGLRITVERTSGDGELFLQVFDPRCPDNGPGTFPRLIAANYASGPDKSVVYIDQSALEPVLVRVFQPGDVQTVGYDLFVEDLAFDDGFEPNDTALEAVSLPNAASVTFMDLVLRDDDWYLVNATAGEDIDVFVDFNGASGDVNLQVFDLTNYFGPGFPTELIGFSYGFGDTEAVSFSTQETTAVGIRVYGERGSTNVYDLTVQRTGGNAPRSMAPIVEFAERLDVGQAAFAMADGKTLDMWAAADAARIVNDGSDAFEPNQTPEQAEANVIELGTTGFDAVANDDDWYVIERQACGTLQILVTYDEAAAASPLGLQLFTERCPPNGPGTFPRLIAADYTATDGVLNVVTLNTTAEERILARIYRLDSSSPFETIAEGVPYSVEIKDIDFDDALEDNDVPWNPTRLANPAVGETETLEHLILRDDDYFAVQVVEGAVFTLTIEFPGLSGDLNLQAFDLVPDPDSAFPEPVAFSYGFGDSESVTITPAPGTTDILVRVYGERGSTNVYDLTYGWTAAP